MRRVIVCLLLFPYGIKVVTICLYFSTFFFFFFWRIEVFGAGSGIALNRAWKFGRMAGFGMY